jgi:dihydrolipoamide dehydrogenase
MATSAAAFDFDVLFIGAGPGGYVGAIRAAQNGLKTGVVEKEERPGGTCLLRGCIPTKSLLESASLLESIQDAAEFGILPTGVSFDWSAVNKRKDKVVTKNANGVKFLFRKNGIEHVVGSATLTAPNTVEVTASTGAKRTIRARHVVLATGSATRHIPIAPVDGQRIFTSDELLKIDRVPASFIVVGAGAVGVEFASVFERFGSKVTVLEMLPRLLPIEDAEISAEFERIFKRRKITVLTSTAMKEVKTLPDGVEVLVERNGATETFRAEALLIAVGRRPVTEGLGLEQFKGVALDRGYVKVKPLYETGEAWLSAIGDIVAVPGRVHPQLAHLASAEGVLVADRLAGKHVEPLNYDHVISATYSEPEVASVGLSEARARELHGAIKIGKFPYAAIGKASVVGHTEGFIKIIASEKHDELLGMHIIGAKATELIHEGALGLRLESTSEELWRTIHAHPTLSEGIMEAAHAVEGKSIGA